MLEFDINGLNNAWENTRHVVEYQIFSAGSSPTRLFLDTSIRLFRDVEPPSSLSYRDSPYIDEWSEDILM